MTRICHLSCLIPHINIFPSIGMYKQQKIDELFTKRGDHSCIDTMRKCFDTNKVEFPLLKQPAPPILRNYLPRSDKRMTPTFPAGFQHNTPIKVTGLSRGYDRQEICIKSKKTVPNSINSFLLELTTKINQEFDEEDLHSQNTTKSSPEHKFIAELKRTNNAGLLTHCNNDCYENSIKINNHTNQLNTLNSRSQTRPNQEKSSETRPNREKSSETRPNWEKSSKERDHKKSSLPHSFLEKHHCQTNLDSNQKSKVELDACAKTLAINTISTSSQLSKFIGSSEKVETPKMKKGYFTYARKAKQLLKKYMDNDCKLGRGEFDRCRCEGVTATSYLVMNWKSWKVLYQRGSEQMIEIASLTKIMTCYFCLLACRKYGVEAKKLNVRVSDQAAEMPGTSAELRAGDVVPLHDLLYGLMLPSGNDASVAVAEAVGKIIQRFRKKPTKKSHLATFIAQMNLLAKQLQIEQTYQNTSGLSLHPNISTPQAISVLSVLAMNDQQFSQIVNTKQYQLQIKNERYGLSRKQTWRNTNKLLWHGWQGIKTGTTESAGHCLMAVKSDLLISVYNCNSLSRRFTECQKLYDFVKNMKE